MAERLEVVGLSKSFNTRTPAIADLSLGIERGGCLCLLGPAGAGKSTLLHLIAGFETPDSGRILAGADDLTNLPPERRRCHLVSGKPQLLPNLTVAGNLAFALEQTTGRTADLDQEVRGALARIGADHLAEVPADALGPGDTLDIIAARAALCGARALLLDEPFSGDAPDTRRVLADRLHALQQMLGLTLAVATTDPHDALQLGTQIAVLSQGRLQQAGDAETLFDKPANAFVAAYVAGANCLPARICDAVGAICTATIGAASADETEQVSVNALAVGPCHPGEAVCIAVRPDQIIVDAPADHPNRIIATVETAILPDAEDADREIWLRVNEETLVRARLPHAGPHALAMPQPGQTLAIAWKTEASRALDPA